MMKKIILTLIFILITAQVFAASNPVLKTENFDSDDQAKEYFYVKLPVEINYQGEKVFADKDTPLVVEDRFKWKSAVDYNSCSNQCGSGNFAITYSCEKSVLYGKEVVSDDLCVAKIGAKPTLPGPTCVSWNDCGQNYQYSEWSACEGDSTSNREAICVDQDENPLPMDACASLEKEDVIRECSYLTSCKDVLVTNPAANSGFYPLSPDSENIYNIYCEMETEGGGWIVLGYSGGSASSNLTSSPLPGVKGYINDLIMRKFAANADQVMFKRMDVVQYIMSVPGSHPIQQLKVGNQMMRVGTNHTFWTSPQGIVTSTRFSRSCGGGGSYAGGVFMWACGNESGIHTFSSSSQWAYNGGSFQSALMIR